jgi:hypothetical protein
VVLRSDSASAPASASAESSAGEPAYADAA